MISWSLVCGDIFSSRDSLGQCISEDLKMSHGISVGFKKEVY